MKCNKALGSISRRTVLLIVTGLTMIMFGCSIPNQMSSSTQSSSGSAAPSAGPSSDQAAGMPTGTDPGKPGAQADDGFGETDGDLENEVSTTPGRNPETLAEGGEPLGSADVQLDESLDEFDGLFEGGTSNSNVDILDPMGAEPATMSSDEPLFEELDGNATFEEVADSAPNTSGPSGKTGDQELGGTSGSVGVSQPLPDDIGDGRGDNVIERQIRQAALQETDPELRAQLWDEYRRMKGQKD
ncbi:MAG TPA: hypothetical protein DEF72_08505 [Gammaproteobacteria bacterium]|nr:hypothetical protein [Gammaproteobacteria bacterium]